MGGEADRVRALTQRQDSLSPETRARRDRDFLAEVEALTSSFWLSNLSNVSSLVFNGMADLNWVGFYLCVAPQVMKLGPFCGLPACLEIPFGKGVCGSAARTRATQVVADVDAFPRHIACDSMSKSEVVVPIVVEDRLIGVFDIDSPLLNRFDSDDIRLFESIARILQEKTDWPDWIGPE